MNLSGALLLAVVAMLSWWMFKLTGMDESNRIQAPPHSADYFSYGYTKREMDETGLLKSLLIAKEIRHYSDDGTTAMKQPLMHFYNEKTEPWVIKSETGLLSADGKDLLLNGSVTIDRKSSPRVRPLTINTFNLKVKPETSYAETGEWAEILSPPNRTSGTGMKMVYTQPVHLELLSHVKGKYETK